MARLRLVWTEELAHEVGPLQDALAALGVGVEGQGPLAGRPAVEAAVAGGGAELGFAAGAPDASSSRAVVLRREEPRDVLIPARGRPGSLAALPAGSRVGLAGGRRTGFLRAHRPDLLPVAPWNGGGPGEALRSGSIDALVLGAGEARAHAVAGHVTEVLDAKAWIPAPAQGARLLLGREGGAWQSLEDATTRRALEAEAAARAALGAGPDAPLGILAMPHGRWVRVWGMVASPDGRRVVRGDVTGPASEPGAAGATLARLLVERGAAALLETA